MKMSITSAQKIKEIQATVGVPVATAKPKVPKGLDIKPKEIGFGSGSFSKNLQKYKKLMEGKKSGEPEADFMQFERFDSR